MIIGEILNHGLCFAQSNVVWLAALSWELPKLHLHNTAETRRPPAPPFSEMNYQNKALYISHIYNACYNVVCLLHYTVCGGKCWWLQCSYSTM